MGNKTNERSRRLKTPSLEREVERTQVKTHNTGNMTLTNVVSESQGIIGECNTESQLNEPSLISNEIQFLDTNTRRKDNDRIAKMRQEIENNSSQY